MIRQSGKNQPLDSSMRYLMHQGATLMLPTGPHH